MKNYRYILYINDNVLFLYDYKKKKLYKKECNYLEKNQIINNKFYFEFHEFIRKNKIKISLWGYKLKFIIPDNLSNLQKNKYKEILEDYFKKVNIINQTKLFSINKNKSIINVNKSYIEYYYLKKGKIYCQNVNIDLFNDNVLKSITFLIKTLFKPEKILLYGNNKDIPLVATKLNKEFNIFCTYEEQFDSYILNIFLKRNT